MEIDKWLDEVEARANAATEGPWCWTYSSHKDNGYMVGKAWQDGVPCEGHVENDDDFEEPILIGEHEAATCDYANPHFIANARTDIPRLLAIARAGVELAEAVEQDQADREFQKKTGGLYFTSAQTEWEEKRDSRAKAEKHLKAALDAFDKAVKG